MEGLAEALRKEESPDCVSNRGFGLGWAQDSPMSWKDLLMATRGGSIMAVVRITLSLFTIIDAYWTRHQFSASPSACSGATYFIGFTS